MPRPPKFEERREAIMRAFELCVARKGLPGTTLADVADEAGLPRSLVRYFMGNRDEMVDRLIERVVTRASAMLAEKAGDNASANVATLLDLYLNEIFAVEPSSAVMGELWHLSRTDEHVRERLRQVYDYSVERLARAFEREGLGTDASARRDAAFAIVSLVLGQLTLADFRVEGPGGADMRGIADMIVDRLRTNAMETSA